MYKKCIKRCLDFMLSLCGIIVLSPILIVLAVLVRVKLGSPVLFKQERPGKDEKIFTLCKFRTMTDARDERGELLPDAVRLTKFGKFLRATSLDELPELFNILRGDMSVIGPRPLLVSYLPYYTERERLRHSVRPGLTGLGQCSDQASQEDVEYVEHLTFGMDMKVLWMTVQTVFGHTDEVAEDTNVAEGNFAEIRKKRLEETGSLEA